MGARLRVTSMLVGVGLLAGCSTSASRHSAYDNDNVASPVPPGDPGYAMTALHDTPAGDYGVLPSTLAEALPHHRVILRGKTQDHTVTFSRALVVGNVLRVDKGSGVVWRDDKSYRVTNFDDAHADTRTVLVSMSTDQMIGAPVPASGRVMFRVLVPQETDPERFAEGLAGLGRIAVVLDRDPSKVDVTPWRPIIDDRMILVVADDGTLSLPTVRHGRDFAGDIHTVDDLLAVARAPVSTSTLDAHRFLP